MWINQISKVISQLSKESLLSKQWSSSHSTEQNRPKLMMMPFNTIQCHAMPFECHLKIISGAGNAKNTGKLIFLNKRGGNDQCRWHKFEFPERAQWVNISKYILKNKNISHISAAMKCFSPTTFLAQLFQIKAGLKMWDCENEPPCWEHNGTSQSLLG